MNTVYSLDMTMSALSQYKGLHVLDITVSTYSRLSNVRGYENRTHSIKQRKIFQIFVHFQHLGKVFG